VRRPVRHLALLPTVEDDEAESALLETRATASGIGAVRARLQVRRLLGRGASSFRRVGRGAELWMRCLGVSAVFGQPRRPRCA
jgi:hypothetical protein